MRCLVEFPITAAADINVLRVDAEAAALKVATVIILARLHISTSAGKLWRVLIVPLGEEVTVEVLLVDKPVAAQRTLEVTRTRALDGAI